MADIQGRLADLFFFRLKMVLGKLSNAQILLGATAAVVSAHSMIVFQRETKYKAALDRIMAGRLVIVETSVSTLS